MTDARVKELYRALVRRLHPDLRADGNAAVSALWHEVQEAYAASDVARMELLLALSDLESSQVGEQTSSVPDALGSAPNYNERGARSRKASRRHRAKTPGTSPALAPMTNCGYGFSVSSSPILHRAPCASVSSRAPSRPGREVHP